MSAATRAALQERVSLSAYTRFLSDEELATLQEVVETILPQGRVGTNVNLAESIDRRLADGKSAGWRFAVLPPDGEAYRRGLRALRQWVVATSRTALKDMPSVDREICLRSITDGAADESASFPLSTFMTMLRGDVVRLWMSHPDTMAALQLYSFATGATGRTDGPTATEGWEQMTPDTAKPFEHGNSVLERGA